MALTFLMLFLMFSMPDGQKYKEPLTKTIEASYQNTELQHMVNEGTSNIKEMHPIVTGVTAVAYTVGIQHKLNLVSSKYSPISNTRISVTADTKNVLFALTWTI